MAQSRREVFTQSSFLSQHINGHSWSKSGQLCGIVHSFSERWLLGNQSTFFCKEMNSFLLLLDQVAAATAPRLEDILNEVALEFWLATLADIVTLEKSWDTCNAEAGGEVPTEALCHS